GHARLDHARLAHLQPQVIAFARALAHAGKHGEAAVLLGDVIDEFHDDHGLAHARAPEQPDLSAFQERLDEVNYLHAGFKHLCRGGLLVEGRRRPVNGQALGGLDGAKLIHRFANHVHHPAQRARSYGHGDGLAQVNGLHAAHHAVGGLHGYAARPALAQVLLDFQHDVDLHRRVEAVAHYPHRLVNRRQLGFFELHVHYRSGDLYYVSSIFRHVSVPRELVSSFEFQVSSEGLVETGNSKLET